ncbi:MAG: hypothetical protein WHU94_10955 [Thermogemmata sp.]|uniref:Uncharacterized protein n=1 Tax=Thermogemmata fonticola TaxID=2755323 RepID=A0A7V9ACC8_9BACT|nr:hypothetical protein [Thermogemmata fonticola]MBA2226657.1 hypothetical protein [Thermogemmata fonticola]
MKVTSVIARFISLVDVVLILLGVLLLVLLHAQVRTQVQRPQEDKRDEIQKVAGLDFLYFYVGWKGPEKDRCYFLDTNLKLGREVRTETADDLQMILKTRHPQGERTNPVVLLLFSEEGWYSTWDSKRIAALEQTWKIKVVPVYNVRFPH